MALRWSGWLLVALVCLSSRAMASPAPPDCSNPQAAMDTLFRWLQPANYNPQNAAACLAVLDGAQGERLAVQLKQVLDARELYVPVATMPSAPNHRDAQGNAKVVPMPEAFPVLVIVQGADKQWRVASPTPHRLFFECLV